MTTEKKRLKDLTPRDIDEKNAQQWAVHYLNRELNPSELVVLLGVYDNLMLPMFECIERYAIELGIDLQPLRNKPVEDNEEDEISPEDLEAAADMMDKITSGTSADVQANDWARIYLDRNLTDKELNTVLGRYATNLLPMEAVVRLYSEEINSKMKTTVNAVKPHVIRVNVDLYYEINPDTLPGWADELGVEKLVESAFSNHNRALTLTGLAEVLGQHTA